MVPLERNDMAEGVLMHSKQRRDAGFTLVELAIAITIMTAALLMVPLVGAKFSKTVSTNRIRNEANAVADAWVARCRSEPNYVALDSSVTGKCRGIVSSLGSYNFTRTTTVVTDATLSGVADSLNDYKRITVVVSGGGLATTVTRTITIAKP